MSDQLYFFYVIFISSEPGPAPQNVTAVSKTFSSIHVSWDPVPEDKRHGIITKYHVHVLRMKDPALPTPKPQPTPKHIYTENHTTEIRDLEMFVLYRIDVRAYTRIGYGDYSDPPIMLKTLETGTALPDCLNFFNIYFNHIHHLHD